MTSDLRASVETNIGDRSDRVRAEIALEAQAPPRSPTAVIERQIVVAGTFTVDLLREPLKFWMDSLEISAGVEVAPYAQVMQEVLSPTSLFGRNRDGFNILLLRLEDWIRDRLAEPAAANLVHLYRATRDLLEGLEQLQSRAKTALLIFLCPTSSSLPSLYRGPIGELELEIAKRVEALSGVYLFSHDELQRLYPLATYEDVRADRMAHIPYVSDYFAALATLLARRIAAILKPPYKVIAVDCDNTLWRGVCGEDGATGVELTAAYLKFQKLLVGQHDAGMLLCLCSKNNSPDVEAVFASQPEMPLREQHLVCTRVNWHAKSANLESLAQELDLSLDSFVFIDDSALECAEVRTRCPAVLALQFPGTDTDIEHFMNHVWAFDRVGVTEEAQRRTAQYTENRARNQALERAGSLEQFLASLELDINVSPMGPEHVDRVAELTQRTNQFNLTTRRRTAADIEQLRMSNDIEGWVVHVKDRFGDYGLVGVVFFRQTHSSIELDTFLLSCRALGRGVEHRIVNELGRVAHERELSNVVLKYRPTPRSAPARAFLHESFSEFVVNRDDEETTFCVPAERAESARPSTEAVSLADAAPQRTASAVGRASSTKWHEAALRMSRVEDLVRELARRTSKGRQRAGGYVPPRNSTEATLCAVCAEVLGIDRIGIFDNFFEFGGDSLMAVRALSKMSAALGAELALHCFLEEPTIAFAAGRFTEELDDAIRAGQRASVAELPLTRRSPDARVPLTCQQMMWWRHAIATTGGLSQRLAFTAVRLSGELDVDVLQRSLDAACERHEALRTRFVLGAYGPEQYVDPPHRCEFGVTDLSNRSATDAEAQLRRMAVDLVELEVDLSAGPLLEARLFRLSARDYVLLLAIDHMITDDVSNRIVMRELWTSYDQASRGLPISIPAPAFQFADYAVWQERTCASWLEQHAMYWRNRLAGTPKMELAPNAERRAEAAARSVMEEFRFGVEQSDGLRKFARQEGVLLAVVMLTIYVTAISNWLKQRDLLVALISNGRYRRELQDVVGFLVNVLCLRIQMVAGDSLVELLRRVDAELREAYEHRDYDRVPSFVPEWTAQVSFNWVSAHEPLGSAGSPGSTVEIQRFDLEVPWPRKFTAVFQDSPEGVSLKVTYRPDLIAGEAVHNLFADLVRTAAEATEVLAVPVR